MKRLLRDMPDELVPDEQRTIISEASIRKQTFVIETFGEKCI